MNRFFNELFNRNILKHFADLFDWLFDDNRFSTQHGWTRGYLGSFIKKVKRINGFKLNNYEYNSVSKLNFNNIKNEEFIFIHSSKDGEARDLVRHIRNGIAHGTVNFIRIQNKELLKIVDYGKKMSKLHIYLFHLIN